MRTRTAILVPDRRWPDIGIRLKLPRRQHRNSPGQTGKSRPQVSRAIWGGEAVLAVTFAASQPDNVGMAQCTRDVLMIRPCRFGPNEATAASNRFQQTPVESLVTTRSKAVAEFDGMVNALRSAGVRILVGEDTGVPAKPDAIFPNNWVTFHDNGDVVLYPLEAVSRRPERRPDVIEWLACEGGFRINRVLDLSWLERRGAFLEGTGSLVLDRSNKVAYAALSSRTHPVALAEFARQTGFEVISFETRDDSAQPVYHTNVVLSLGENCAVICADAIAGAGDRERIVSRIAMTGRQIIEISLAQMRSFAANVLELDTGGQGRVMVMSTAASKALTANQSAALAECAQPLALPLDTIERVGGGSARCMMAEIFLPYLDATH